MSIRIINVKVFFKGASLNQYIIYALTYQIASNYKMIIKSELDKAQQEQ
ncbi:hypothetical protein CY0110_25621 [Crocosphaera chwakensis CCY0110]|uniref:Uncharacterized protein n=1 Tax=Crocosphaera chwakensis CCY0110 TaxID=391612 RepID=A3IRM4_9CHRO|nr:hypothetical protein CY0110_25621 [Crocosphaera chwakensis CCY0110]